MKIEIEMECAASPWDITHELGLLILGSTKIKATLGTISTKGPDGLLHVSKFRDIPEEEQEVLDALTPEQREEYNRFVGMDVPDGYEEV